MHNKPVRPKAPAPNPLRILQACRPYADGEVAPEIVECRLAYHRLTTGEGSTVDFDLVSTTLRAILVRCEEIHPTLRNKVRDGLKALTRASVRFTSQGQFVFDEQDGRDMSEALEVFEAVAEGSSPMQMVQAIRESYRRTRLGIFVVAETQPKERP